MTRDDDRDGGQGRNHNRHRCSGLGGDTAMLQIRRTHNDPVITLRWANPELHFVCFISIKKMKGPPAEQIFFINRIKCSGKTLIVSAGLSFTNYSLALHHWPFWSEAKTEMVEKIWQRTNKENKQTSKTVLLTAFHESPTEKRTRKLTVDNKK